MMNFMIPNASEDLSDYIIDTEDIPMNIHGYDRGIIA